MKKVTESNESLAAITKTSSSLSEKKNDAH